MKNGRGKAILSPSSGGRSTLQVPRRKYGNLQSMLQAHETEPFQHERKRSLGQTKLPLSGAIVQAYSVLHPNLFVAHSKLTELGQ